MSSLLQQQRKLAREGTWLRKSQRDKERQQEELLRRIKEEQEKLQDQKEQEEILRQEQQRRAQEVMQRESEQVFEDTTFEEEQNKNLDLCNESLPHCIVNNDLLGEQSLEDYLNSLQVSAENRDNRRSEVIQPYFQETDSERSEEDNRICEIRRTQELGNQRWARNGFLSSQQVSGDAERLNRYVKEQRLSQAACDLLMELVDEPTENIGEQLKIENQQQQWNQFVDSNYRGNHDWYEQNLAQQNQRQKWNFNRTQQNTVQVESPMISNQQTQPDLSCADVDQDTNHMVKDQQAKKYKSIPPSVPGNSIQNRSHQQRTREDGLSNQRSSQQIRNEERILCLDQQLCDLLVRIKPSLEERQKIKQSIDIVFAVLLESFKGSKCHLYGSVGNDLWVHDNNDLDICIETLRKDTDHNYLQEIVHELQEFLENKMEDVQALRRARVPICKFIVPDTGTEVDISVNNLLPVHNTALIKAYCTIDPQIRDLSQVVKYWAKRRRLNDTRNNTLSSYAYVLLVIFFMQQTRGVPCLQKDNEENFEECNGCNVYYRKDVQQIERPNSEVKGIGQLALSFFKFYDRFLRKKSQDYVISVRLGCFLPQSQKTWPEGKKHLFSIEDPFEVDHDLGIVLVDNTFNIICKSFATAGFILESEYQDIWRMFDERRVYRQMR